MQFSDLYLSVSILSNYIYLYLYLNSVRVSACPPLYSLFSSYF